MRRIYEGPLPNGWVEAPLQLVARRRRGYSWSKEQEIDSPEVDAVPVVRIPNIRHRLDLRDMLYLRGVSADDLAAFSVDKGWILFVASNGNPDRIGDSVLIDADRAMMFASFLQGITTRHDAGLAPEFLANWMRLHLVHQTFSKTSQATTGLANFSWSAVRNLPVRFPSDVEEQRRVLMTLSHAQASAALLEDQVAALERLRRAMLQAMFRGDLSTRHPALQDSPIGAMPATWGVTRLGALLDHLEAGSSPQCESYPAREGHWGVLKVSAVSWDAFDEKENKELPAALQPDMAAQVHSGDLIVSRANTTGLAGAAQIARDLRTNLLLCDKTWRLVPREGIDREWLVLVLKSQRTRRQLEALATGTSDSMKNISMRDFRRVWVPLPPEPERVEQVSLYREVESYGTLLSAKTQLADHLQRSLRRSLLTGRVRVPAGSPQ